MPLGMVSAYGSWTLGNWLKALDLFSRELYPPLTHTDTERQFYFSLGIPEPLRVEGVSALYAHS